LAQAYSEALPTCPITQVIKNERDQLIPNGFKTTFIKHSIKNLNGNNVTLSNQLKILENSYIITI
jgi:hypothetical protein